MNNLKVWDEMILRRNLLRAGYELQKAQWEYFENYNSKAKGEYGYRLFAPDGGYYIHNTVYPGDSMTLEEAVATAKVLCGKEGVVYQEGIPERELESAEENYIEDQTGRAHDYYYTQMLELRGKEIENLEADGVRQSVIRLLMQQIEDKWSRWVDDMTVNAEQNYIAECLETEGDDDEGMD